MSRESLLTATCNIPEGLGHSRPCNWPKRSSADISFPSLTWTSPCSSDPIYWPAAVCISEASDTSSDRVLTVQTNWFLLAAYRSHWLLWQASLSTREVQQLEVCLPNICSFSTWPDRSMPHCPAASGRPYIRHTSARGACSACMVASQSPSLSSSIFWLCSATHCELTHLVPLRFTPHFSALRDKKTTRHVACATLT